MGCRGASDVGRPALAGGNRNHWNFSAYRGTRLNWCFTSEIRMGGLESGAELRFGRMAILQTA